VTDASVSRSEAPSQTSLSLLDRVRAQDQAAWSRLVLLYGPLVYRWCRRAGLQAADAADVGQEVFRAVARKVSEFRHDRDGDSFRAWLRAITRNKILDAFRRPAPGCPPPGGSDAQRRLQEVPTRVLEDAGPAADAEETRLLFRQAVELMRGEFEEGTWRAFWQAAVEGRRPADVAADLGVSVNVVYLAKSRILRRLREEFADLLGPRPPSGPAV
jgi:RNA polymerase sigma-70 factor, ECF subfamily